MTDLVKHEELPSYLVEVTESSGLEEVKKNLVPSTIRIIQKMSSDALKAKFNEGEAVLLPEGVALASKDVKVEIVPVFLYVEYVAWNPRATRGTEPAIRAKTFDETSDLAKKCMNPDTYKEDHPNFPGDAKKQISNNKMLNFMVVILREDVPPMPALLSFSSTGMADGQAWCNLISARTHTDKDGKPVQSPIFSGRYTMTIKDKQNQEGSWFGLAIDNAEEKYVSAEEFKLFKQLHEDLKSRQIDADYGEDDAVPSPKEAKTDF